MTAIELGDTIPFKGQQFRVIRIVDHSLTLYQHENRLSVVDEVYLELKGDDGSIDFLEVSKEERPYTGKLGVIRGLEPSSFQKVSDD